MQIKEFREFYFKWKELAVQDAKCYQRLSFLTRCAASGCVPNTLRLRYRAEARCHNEGTAQEIDKHLRLASMNILQEVKLDAEEEYNFYHEKFQATEQEFIQCVPRGITREVRNEINNTYKSVMNGWLLNFTRKESFLKEKMPSEQERPPNRNFENTLEVDRVRIPNTEKTQGNSTNTITRTRDQGRKRNRRFTKRGKYRRKKKKLNQRRTADLIHNFSSMHLTKATEDLLNKGLTLCQLLNQ